MSLIAVPNISTGTDADAIRRAVAAVEAHGPWVLDVHSDVVHDRTVFTIQGHAPALPQALFALAEVALRTIDLRSQAGLHPRLGAFDVCPLVPLEGRSTMEKAVAAARTTARRLADDLGLPVYLYGHASTRDLELPQIRRGGPERLWRRAAHDLPPDMGPTLVDPRHGVACVGARSTLIAFNVWLDAPVEVASEIARAVREANGGLPGVRALGLAMPEGLSQVSINLVDPEATGIEDVCEQVRRAAQHRGANVVRTELVGLPPERYLPHPDAQAARLMSPPGRSLESLLR